MPTTRPAQPRVRGSVAWSALTLLVVPAAVAALWALGRGWDAIATLVARAGITWPRVWTGLAVAVAYALVVTVIHAVRVHKARTVELETVAADLEARSR